MESSSRATVSNWTEAVEDLVHSGEVDEAIFLLESTVSNLENELGKEEVASKASGKPPSSSVGDQLSTALRDLSKLYASQGLSVKADQTRSRGLQIKWRAGSSKAWVSQNEATSAESTEGYGKSSNLQKDSLAHQSSGEEDWEALVDLAPDQLLSPLNLPEVSELSLGDSQAQSSSSSTTTTTTNRRGRGKFSYRGQGLYSDCPSGIPDFDNYDSETDPTPLDERRDLTFGTRHVLVLADLPVITRTTDLERLLVNFKDNFVIRWVDDTTSLAVFKNPSLALVAINSIKCPFKTRILTEDDELLSSIKASDLKPPTQRPPTDARAASRMIAQELNIKLPSNFGAAELRKQEAERKDRIASRQNKRDEAWGSD